MQALACAGGKTTKNRKHYVKYTNLIDFSGFNLVFAKRPHFVKNTPVLVIYNNLLFFPFIHICRNSMLISDGSNCNILTT